MVGTRKVDQQYLDVVHRTGQLQTVPVTALLQDTAPNDNELHGV